MKNQRGEIATLLTLISIGLMLVGVVVGNVAVQQTTQTNSKAAGDPCFVCSGNVCNGGTTDATFPYCSDFGPDWNKGSCNPVNPCITPSATPTATPSVGPSSTPAPGGASATPPPTASATPAATDSVVCGIINNGQECKANKGEKPNFCYNECIPWKPGYSEPIYCEFGKGFVNGEAQKDPACGEVGPTPNLANCPAGLQEGQVQNYCVQLSCDGNRDRWVEIDEVCKGGKIILVPARDTDVSCSVKNPGCIKVKTTPGVTVTPRYNPPPTPTLPPLSSGTSCNLVYECPTNQFGFKKIYEIGNTKKYIRNDSTCKTGPVSNRIWDACGITECSYQGASCSNACPTDKRNQNKLDCTTAYCCGVLTTPTPASSASAACNLFGNCPGAGGAKIFVKATKYYSDCTVNTPKEKPWEVCGITECKYGLGECENTCGSGRINTSTINKYGCTTSQSCCAAGGSLTTPTPIPTVRPTITLTLTPSPSPTASLSTAPTNPIFANASISVRIIGDPVNSVIPAGSTIKIIKCSASTGGTCDPPDKTINIGSQQIVNTTPYVTGAYSISLPPNRQYVTACITISGSDKCSLNRIRGIGTIVIPINLGEFGALASNAAGPITASFTSAGWNYVVNNYNKYEALEVSSWAHASAASGYYPGIQHIFCDVKLGTQPGGCDFYYQQNESMTMDEIYNLITKRFGNSVFGADGTIDLNKITDLTLRQQAEIYNGKLYTASSGNPKCPGPDCDSCARNPSMKGCAGADGIPGNPDDWCNLNKCLPTLPPSQNQQAPGSGNSGNAGNGGSGGSGGGGGGGGGCGSDGDCGAGACCTNGNCHPNNSVQCTGKYPTSSGGCTSGNKKTCIITDGTCTAGASQECGSDGNWGGCTCAN